MAFVLLSIIVIGVAVLLYPYLKAELQDVSPAVLAQQTSVSETRNESESAIYRSVDVPHGVSLTGGLRIQINYKVRDGTLKDVWHCALNNGDSSKSTFKWNDLVYTTKQVNWILHEISAYMASKLSVEKQLLLEAEKDDAPVYKYRRVAFCVKDLFSNPEALLFLLSSFFISEITVVNYTEPIRELPEGIDVAIVDSFAAGYVKKLGFKNIIVIGDSNGESGCTPFSDIVDITNRHIPELDTFDYVPNKDYAVFNNLPYVEVVGGSEVKFFQRNFVASIASKLMSLQSQYAWSNSDSLLIHGDTNTIQNKALIHTTLCGLVSNVSKIEYATNESVNTLEQLAELGTTILSTDSVGLSTLTRSGKKHIKKSFILQRAEYFNADGIFCSFGKLNKELKLKLVYVSQYDQLTSTQSTNLAKSVLGARIIRETLTDVSMGPILKTNIFDYRISHYGSQSLLGVPANSMEAKVKFQKEGESVGTLFVRGMSLGKGSKIVLDDQFWYDTGIKGLFAQDGCFYGSLQ